MKQYLNKIFQDKVDTQSPKPKATMNIKRVREIYRIIKKNDLDRNMSPQAFRACIEELGPVFIKMGQLLAVQSEVLPQSYRSALAELHASCQPTSFTEVMNTLHEVLGEAVIKRTFAFIDPMPLGSASIAQVHKARLVSGEVVAIKVRRPGIVEDMECDLEILYKVAKLLRRRLSKAFAFDPVSAIEEMHVLFREETDFRIEVQNLKEFSYRYAHKRNVLSPVPYEQLCRENIIIMTCMDGTPLVQLKRSDAPSRLGEQMLMLYLDQVITQGFFHADPHPGNIFIKDGAIGFIDMGMMGHLDPVCRSMLGKLIEGAALGNSSMLLDAVLGIVSFEEGRCVDQAALLADIDGLVLRYCTLGVGSFKFASFSSDFISLARCHNLVLPRDLMSAVRGVATIEGSIEEYLGEIDMIRVVRSYTIKQKTKGDAVSSLFTEEASRAMLAYRGGLDALYYSGDIARLVSRGQMRLNIKVLDSRRLVRSLFRTIGWVVFALIIAGLLISASLVDMGSGGMEPLTLGSSATLERIIAIIFLIVLVIDIIRSRESS